MSIPAHYLYPNNGWERVYNPAPPTFITNQASLVINLPAPPWRATEIEVNELRCLFKERPWRQQQISAQDAAPPFEDFANCIGVCSASVVGLDDFMLNIVNEIDQKIYDLKKTFNRARPHQVDPQLSTAISVPNHPAYPSGHSTQAHLLAFALDYLRPGYSSALEEFAFQIAYNREVAGLHYRSDSLVGIQLARDYFGHLRQSSVFNGTVSQIQLRLKAAGY
jgi:acid phosphatase (class A)